MTNTTIGFLLGMILLLCCQSCVEADHEFSKLAPGIWRAELTLEGGKILRDEDDESPIMDNKVLLPFNFEVIYATPDSFYIELHNGEERITVTDILYGRDMALAKDTVLIQFPVFDTYIRAIFIENVMEGRFVVNYRDNYSIPFVAYHGQGHRFVDDGTPADMDLSGKWKTTFEVNTEGAFPAVGEFQQSGNTLRGTFLTETGDYRYLDGHVRENKFALSCFDGSHAFLFDGKIMPDESLLGTFYSGTHYKVLFEATKDENFTLTSPFDLTQAVNPSQPLAFSFQNTDGQQVSLLDEAYTDKVKLIQIMGTWCPNCKDETIFLKQYLADNPSDQLEVIALSFEKYAEKDKAMSAIRTFKKNFEVPYQVLYAGLSDKAEASKQIPQITKITSFPTLLFLDKSNRIRNLHTGFSGPATSEYAAFEDQFSSIVNTLLLE